MRDIRAITVLLAIIVLFVVGFVLSELSTVLLPFVIALFLAFIFKPMVLWLQRHRVPTGLALLSVVAIAGLFLWLISMIIYSSVDAFIGNLPSYQSRLQSLNDRLMSAVAWAVERAGGDPAKFNLSGLLEASTLTGIIASSLGSLISVLSNGFLVLLYLMFLLAGAGGLSAKTRLAFSAHHADRIGNVIDNIDAQVRQYLVTKSLISAIIGVLTTGVLLIFGVDFAALWGVLAFLLNFIPNFGSLIATVFPVLLSLLQFDSIGTTLLLLGVLVVSQNLVGNVLEPKMMEFSLNLSPVLILVTLIFWGWLWGIWGMILAIPITSMIKIVCENVEPLRPIAVLMSGKLKAAKVGRGG